MSFEMRGLPSKCCHGNGAQTQLSWHSSGIANNQELSYFSLSRGLPNQLYRAHTCTAFPAGLPWCVPKSRRSALDSIQTQLYSGSNCTRNEGVKSMHGNRAMPTGIELEWPRIDAAVRNLGEE